VSSHRRDTYRVVSASRFVAGAMEWRLQTSAIRLGQTTTKQLMQFLGNGRLILARRILHVHG
jgi:hypothetical protein